jgi:hypothetical protein
MELLPLDKLGVREISSGSIQFSVFFPWVSAPNGNQVFVKVIHEQDQFLQTIQPLQIPTNYGRVWRLE